MSIVRITSGVTGKVFDVWNYDSYTIDLDTPIEAFALPQQDSTNAQLIKVQGNLSTVTLTWLIAQKKVGESSVWPKVAVTSGPPAERGTFIDISNGSETDHGGWTVERQRNYLRRQFERISVTDGRDTIEVLDNYTALGDPKSPASMNPRDIERGAITKILITRDSNEPVNMRATVSMFVGTTLSGSQ